MRQEGLTAGNTRAAQLAHQAAAAAAAAASVAAVTAANTAANTGPYPVNVSRVGKKATLTPAEEAKLQQRIYLGATMQLVARMRRTLR